MTIVISCGEPAGIGPEVAARAAQALAGEVTLALIGDPRHLPPDVACHVISTPRDAAQAPAGTLPVLARDFGTPATPGRPDPRHAPHVVAAIREGVELCLEGRARALVTAPIHKKALADGAGFAFPGHTEFLAHLAGDVPVVMMLAGAGLRVVPVTIHIPLRDVPRTLTPDLLRQTITLTARGLQRDFAIPRPRLAVSGLNPHAGEGGRMGDEEITLIAPLLEELRAEGFEIAGPLPADTMFHPDARTRYDVAICMYHDQALIPLKTVDFAGGVNVTLGLPFVRTSPDHGTAFDIAGQNRADPASMIAAIRTAAAMAQARQAA